MADRFIRWQGRTIEQLGNLLNLILGLSTTIMGFLINAISNSTLILSCWDKYFYLLSLGFSFLSIGFSIITNIIRLQDFRLTASIARRSEKNETSYDLEADRRRTKKLGKQTWSLFYILMIFFSVSIILTIVFFLRIYSNKIF